MPRSVSRENLPLFRLDGSDGHKSDATDGFVMVGGGGAGGFYPPHVPGQPYQYSPPGGLNMLSTSPGTGGALMAMMHNQQQQQQQQQRQLPRNSLFPSNTSSSAGAVSLGGVDLAAKMLQAAEDIARRAINVAHVGDVEAFNAMKFFISSDSFASATASATASASASASATVSGGESSSSGGEGKSSNESSTTSATSMSAAPFGLELEEVQEDENEGQEEVQEESNQKGEDEASKSVTNTSSAKPTPKAARKHLAEAVSLYFYSLRLMKGAITASQRVSDVVTTISGGASSREGSPILDSHAALLRRCKNSQKWLATQFNGILERAEAGQAKLEALKEMAGAEGVEGADTALTATELIYAAAIKNGREGNAKLLSGELHVSKDLFKTSGILCEALLMEEGLTERDCEVLDKLRDSVRNKVSQIEQTMGSK
jgi:hypothetical protein